MEPFVSLNLPLYFSASFSEKGTSWQQQWCLRNFSLPAGYLSQLGPAVVCVAERFHPPDEFAWMRWWTPRSKPFQPLRKQTILPPQRWLCSSMKTRQIFLSASWKAGVRPCLRGPEFHFSGFFLCPLNKETFGTALKFLHWGLDQMLLSPLTHQSPKRSTKKRNPMTRCPYHGDTDRWPCSPVSCHPMTSGHQSSHISWINEPWDMHGVSLKSSLSEEQESWRFCPFHLNQRSDEKIQTLENLLRLC